MVKVTAGVRYWVFAALVVGAFWWTYPHEDFSYYIFMFFTVYVLSAFGMLGAKVGYNKLTN